MATLNGETYRFSDHCPDCGEDADGCECTICPTCGEPGELNFESHQGELICSDCAHAPEWADDGYPPPTHVAVVGNRRLGIVAPNEGAARTTAVMAYRQQDPDWFLRDPVFVAKAVVK